MKIGANQHSGSFRPALVMTAMAVIMLIFQQGCYYDNEEELYPFALNCDSAGFSYAADIEPILATHCLGCHSATVNSGGVTLAGYSNVVTYANNGLLSCSVNHGDGCFAMPQNLEKLNPCDILAIDTWIAEGQMNN
jgi:hypothetical protein